MTSINLIKDNIYFIWFAMLIFFGGFCFSYIVNELNLKFLMWFPKWFMKVLVRFVNPSAGFARIVAVIFLFNSLSIMLYLISGLFIIFPFIIAFMTGMNIGLTIFIPPDDTIERIEINTPGKAVRFMVLSTLVLICEVSVFSIALGLSMSMAAAASTITVNNLTNALFLSEILSVRMAAYFDICMPVLFLSAILEAKVIKGA